MARGRPRKDGPREPNGRPQRERELTPKEIADNQAVAINYRIRVFGVDEKYARSQMAATAHGRMALCGNQGGGLSLDQYQTANRWLADRNAYLRAIGAPMTAIDPQDRVGNYDPSEDAYEAFTKRAKSQWKAIRDFVFDEMETARRAGGNLNAAEALYAVLVEDREDYRFAPDLRTILNALERFYSEGKRRAA